MLTTDEIQGLPRPPGAWSFFAADENGGSGFWIGEKYDFDHPFYVTLPDSMVETYLLLPGTNDEAEPAATEYVDMLRALVDSAAAYFGKVV